MRSMPLQGRRGGRKPGRARPGAKVVRLLNGFAATSQDPTQELHALAIDLTDKA